MPGSIERLTVAVRTQAADFRRQWPSAAPLVSVDSMAPFLSFLATRGAPAYAWMREAGLPLAELRRPSGVVSLHQCYRFLNSTLRNEGLARLPVLVGERVSPFVLGRLGAGLRSAMTVGDYLAIGARLVSTASNSGACLWLEEEGDLLRFNQLFASGEGEGPGIIDVYTLMVTLQTLRQFLGDSWRPEEVHLQAGSERFLDDGDVLAHQRVATGRLYTSFTLPRAFLSHPVRVPSRKIVLRVDEPANSLPCDFVDALSRLVLGALDDSSADLSTIAAAVNLSPRGLQRRLAEHGTTYRDLLTSCRIRRAKEWLAHTKKPVSIVAADLGYTDASNFARAFQRETAMSPTAWRHLHARTCT